jgi:hypothetical protein
MGATAPDDGWMACIAATNSGVTRYVRSGDELDTAPQRARVARVDDEGVCVTVDGLEALLPWAAEEERAALTERWATQARQRQADVAAAARPPEPEVLPMYPQPERPGPTLPDRPPQRRIGFGVDYPYPVEYEVIPVRMRTPDGRVVDRGILLPTRFERRAAGVYGSTIEHSSGMGPRILPGPAPRYP